MKTLTIKTTEGRTLETSEQMFFSISEIRQLWPDIYQSNFTAGEDYTVTDEDGNEVTGEDAKIFVDGYPTQWYGIDPKIDSWDAWGVDADGDGKYTLSLSSEGEPDIYYFGFPASFVAEKLQKIADSEEDYQDSLDDDDQDYTYFNKIIECIEAISK